MPRRKDQTDQSDEDEDDESMDAEKIQIRKPKIERIDKFKNLKKIVINVSMTQYPVVSEVAEDLGWKIQTSNDAGDWDVYWTDFSIDPDVLIKMHLFQKINHFPGIHVIARKNLLGHNLTNMGKRFPDEYNFFPMTWMLPQQYAEFREYYESKQKGKTRTYIVKPQADCQGRGIFLTRKIEDMQTGKHYVVQRYMARPYLLDGLKFDMRIYVLMCGTDPLKLYLYNQGLARLATQPYQQPMNANLDRLCMHLTNYAINKFNPNFIFNNNVNNMGIGHKRALSCVFKQLAQRGLDVDKLKQKIKDIIIKTIISGLPLMSHQYKFSQPEDYSGNMCFHILGMDVMINSKGDPYVIQVNHTPSFTTDTPLDHKIKFSLIKDSLVLMNVNVKQKNQLYNRCKEYNSQRLLTGKRHIYEGQDRQAKIKEAQQERQKYQSKHLGGFQKIFPLDDPQKNSKYEEMIGAAMRMYMQQNQAVRARYEQKEMKKLMRSQLKAKKIAKEPQVGEQATAEITNLVENDSVVSQGETNEAAPRQQNLTLSQPIPVIENQICQNLKKQLQNASTNGKLEKAEASVSDMRRVNQIRRVGVRDNSYTAQRKQKSQKIIQQGKFFNRDKLRASSKRSTPTDFKRTDGSDYTQKQSSALTNGGIIQLIQGIDNKNRNKKTERIIQNKFILKSQPKPMKLLESIEKELKNNFDRKFQNINNNGGFVMPKIYSLNVQQDSKEQFNFLSLGRKVQSTLYSNNNNA